MAEHVDEFNKEIRKWEGGNDGEGDDETRNPEDIPMEDLLKRANVHMMQTSNTEWDDTEHCYKFMPVCGTSRRKLGTLGIGVQLYFEFLAQMGILFLIMSLLTAPLLVSSAMGDMVSSEGVQQFFGMLSVANLGQCGPGHSSCTTVESLQNRKALLDFDLDFTVKELTPWFGTLDGAALLLFMCYGVFFRYFWIPRKNAIHMKEHVTPADFTLRVFYLPRKLPDMEEHQKYTELLTTHFTGLLQTRCDCKDEEPVVEVSLVRDYHRNLDDRMMQGQYLLQKENLEVKLEREKDDKKKPGIQKQIEQVNRSIAKLQKSLGEAAGFPEEQREVCNTAFVTFKKEAYALSLLHLYRYAESTFFRCCQDEGLRFQGRCIMVQRASEPSDIYWENMDLPNRYRKVRLCVTCLLTFVLLVICFAAMLACKMVSASGIGPAPPADVWVVKSLKDSQCLSVCDWAVFSDSRCRSPAGGFKDIVGVWDASGSYTADPLSHPALTACVNGSWSSPVCAASAQQETPQWIGIQMANVTELACMTFVQGFSSAMAQVELYGCSSETLAGLNSSALAAWRPEDGCLGLQDLTPSVLSADSAWSPSGRQLVLQDTTCRRPISYDAAVASLEAKAALLQTASGLSASDARYRASTEDPTINCYCTQQQDIVGASFRAPPYKATPSKALCEDWIYYKNVQLSMLIGGVAMVTILNSVLVYVLKFFVESERHETRTQQTNSQFLKLFLAQFLNTALIVLIVNANWRGSFEDVEIIELLGFGQGTYDDFESDWYTSVGSGICLTIVLQVFSSTASPLIMSYFVNPVLIWFFRRGLVTQKILNSVFELPEWELASRLAQSYVVICVVMMYSGGMPILNLVGGLYCLVAYWLDKWCLLKGSRRPPSYTPRLLQVSIAMIPVAAFMHAFVSLWSLGNQNVFPAEWSVLKGFMAGLIGTDDEEYEQVRESYYVSNDETKKNLFRDYLRVRLLDMARRSCWLLLIIFLVFLVYYIVTILMSLFLKPIVAPCLIAIRGKCAKRKGAAEGEGESFADAAPNMLRLNHIPSYMPHMNPKYKMLVEAMQSEEVKESIEANEERKQAKKGCCACCHKRRQPEEGLTQV